MYSRSQPVHPIRTHAPSLVCSQTPQNLVEPDIRSPMAQGFSISPPRTPHCDRLRPHLPQGVLSTPEEAVAAATPSQRTRVDGVRATERHRENAQIAPGSPTQKYNIPVSILQLDEVITFSRVTILIGIVNSLVGIGHLSTFRVELYISDRNSKG